MTFAIETPTKAKLEDVRVLSQKNRQADENPGIQLHLSMKLSNHELAMLDGSLKGFLFTKNGVDKPVATKRKDNTTGALDGVEPVSDLPNLSPIGSKVKAIKWNDEVSGCLLTVSFATTKLEIDDSTASSFKIQPQEGGTVVVKFIVEAPDASEKIFAKLAKYKSREVEIQIVQHEAVQTGIEDEVHAEIPKGRRRASGEPVEAWPFPDPDKRKGAQAQDAGEAFAAAHGKH